MGGTGGSAIVRRLDTGEPEGRQDVEKLHHVADGIECMAFLRNEGDYGETPTPDLVLLDLRMPRMDGHGVLAALMDDEALHHLPVIVLSASCDEEDILQAYQLRCSSYVVKPMDFDHFRQKIRAIGNYWLSLAALPCAA